MKEDSSPCNQKALHLLWKSKPFVMDAVATNYVPQAAAATHTPDRVIALLRATYGLVPIVAGADKFVNLLTDWDRYLAPVVSEVLPLSAETFMGIVGVIEIAAGVLVLARPKVGSLVVAGWLAAIALNLLLSGQYFDIAVRDLVMAIGAFSLFMLTRNRDKGKGIGD